MSTGGSTAGNVRDSKVKELYLFYFMIICCVITGKISELDWLADNKDNPINPIKRGKELGIYLSTTDSSHTDLKVYEGMSRKERRDRKINQ